MIEITLWIEHSRELHEPQDVELHTTTYLGEDREAFLKYCAHVWEQWHATRNPPRPDRPLQPAPADFTKE